MPYIVITVLCIAQVKLAPIPVPDPRSRSLSPSKGALSKGARRRELVEAYSLIAPAILLGEYYFTPFVEGGGSFSESSVPRSRSRSRSLSLSKGARRRELVEAYSLIAPAIYQNLH